MRLAAVKNEIQKQSHLTDGLGRTQYVNRNKSKGIRISDSAYDGACIDLNEILKELHGGGFFQWSIFEIYLNGYYGTIPSITDFEDTVKKPLGKRLSWEQLSALGNDVNQFLDLIVVGSKDIDQLHWIDKGAGRYENCEFYIEMFDSSFWEVFSKDHAFINRLAHKFKDIEFLEPDFLENEKSYGTKERIKKGEPVEGYNQECLDESV